MAPAETPQGETPFQLPAHVGEGGQGEEPIGPVGDGYLYAAGSKKLGHFDANHGPSHYHGPAGRGGRKTGPEPLGVLEGAHH